MNSNIAEAVTSVHETAQKFAINKVATKCHTQHVMDINECWWQGDLGIQYILGVDATVPELKSHIKVALKQLNSPQEIVQLAENTGEGSQHLLNREEGREYPVIFMVEGTPLLGYVLYAAKGIYVEHPVHCDFYSKVPGWYLVRFQRALSADMSEKLARAID